MSLKKVEAVIEIGRQEKREELHSILLLAQERGGRVTPSDVSQRLLLGRPESIGRALIDRCRYYELLGPDGELTDLGREALETKKVFIPERGRYRVWYTEDPLIPQRLIDVEPVDETRLVDEIMNRDHPKKPETSSEAPIDLPDNLALLEGKSFDLFGSEHGQVVIKKIERKVLTRNLDEKDELRITLRLSPQDLPVLSLEGKFKRTLPSPVVDFERVWIELLGSFSKNWDDLKTPPALRVPFEERGERELASFTIDLPLKGPTFREFGSFDDAVAYEVPVTPRTHQDATQWARWLLLRSIDAYVTSRHYEELVSKAASRFPEYPELRLPTRDQLAEELKTNIRDRSILPEQYWYLQAPLDLSETDELA